MNKYRMTARVVGMVYLAGFVVGIAGNLMIQSIPGGINHLSAISANSMTVAISASLWLMAVAGDATHGVLMFPIQKQHSESIAIGYQSARIVDAVFIAIMVLLIFIQIPLGSEFLKASSTGTSYLQSLSTLFAQSQQYAYEIGMISLGLAGLMLCYTLYRSKLVPQWLAL